MTEKTEYNEITVAKDRPRSLTPKRAWWLTAVLAGGAWMLGLASGCAGWWLMWLLAAAMWLGFKTLALATTAISAWPRGGAGWMGFWLWPGMDADAFVERKFDDNREVVWPTAAGAVFRLFAGAAMIWLVARHMPSALAAGWCAMIGLVLILHFGAFDLLALFWRSVGYPVHALMRAPWRATSLADFWGARWNRAFSYVANRALFRPLTRRFGLAWGTLAGFALSGVAHELVISVPAGGGYGLPTLYFMLQGAGLLFERRLGWRNTARGRIFLALLILGPAFALFHPPFMREVMAPMLTALGALN